jgi:hypothetical protein
MKTIRKFAYAALFTLSALTIGTSPAAAEEARGRFTLTHEVHWQNAVLSAGEYEFSMADNAPSAMLLIRKIDGNRSGYMLMVHDIDTAQATDADRLVLVSRPAGSFVDRLELAQYGVTLHFRVPAERTEIAQASTIASSASGK